MNIERLPDSLLNGKHLHCRPIENGPIIEAQIFPAGEELPTARVVIVCEARRPCSECALRIESGNKDDKCQYYKGDSLGGYQTIGPGMDRKSGKGYKKV